MVKKRGAPAGNTNALKHGFYSTNFKAGELSDLEMLEDSGLDSEINMLRVASRRLFTLVFKDDFLFSDDKDLHLQAVIDSLGALGLAATRVSTLLRSKSLISGNSDSFLSVLSEAMNQVYKDLNI